MQRELLKNLLTHITLENFDDSEGVCNMVYAFNDDDYDQYFKHFLTDCFESWEFFSGSKHYPIKLDQNIGGFHSYLETSFDDFWNHETEYGMLRILLLNHIVDCIRNALKLLEEF